MGERLRTLLMLLAVGPLLGLLAVLADIYPPTEASVFRKMGIAVAYLVPLFVIGLVGVLSETRSNRGRISN